MIAWLVDLLDTEILEPQGDEARGEKRAIRNPDEEALDVEAQSLDVRPITTVPIGYEIGGSVELQHTIAVAVDVQHGDPAEAARLRDAIVLDLILRTRTARAAIAAATDPATGQSVDRIDWSIDWRPLGVGDTNESAVLTFTIDTTLDG
jgi:hypothetical protein